jgi:predicted nucleic acid-binding protein
VTFADSSFWIAEALPRDRRHGEAAQLAVHHSGARLVTSNLVIGETWTFLRRRTGYRFAVSWLDTTWSYAHRLRVERIDSDLEDKAWTWLRVHDERPYSFVDATSFALMRKLRISDALAFDGDFTAAGFVELRPE